MKKNAILITVLAITLMTLIVSNENKFNIKNIKDANWHVYLDNLKTSVINGTAFVPEKPVIDETSIKSYDVLISKSGDSATYTFDVINSGDIDAKLATLVKLEPKCISLLLPENTNDEEIVCQNLDYKISYTKTGKEVNVNDILKAKTKENLTLKIAYKNDLDNLEGDVQITLFDMTFVYNHSK